jgi:hypothetical protein
MRFAGCPVILFLLLNTLLLLPNAPAPVQAGVGMPEIGSLQIGSYRAHLLNDSAGLRRGTNTLTVHIPDLPLGDDVTLRLYGPGGRVDQRSAPPAASAERSGRRPRRGHGFHRRAGARFRRECGPRARTGAGGGCRLG